VIALAVTLLVSLVITPFLRVAKGTVENSRWPNIVKIWIVLTRFADELGGRRPLYCEAAAPNCAIPIFTTVRCCSAAVAGFSFPGGAGGAGATSVQMP
jgi:hypothetical protein